MSTASPFGKLFPMFSARRMTVCVDRNSRGEWEVALPDEGETVTCATLEDACRVAYLCAAHRRPCELVVRDAYHRVLERDSFDDAPPQGRRLTRSRR